MKATREFGSTILAAVDLAGDWANVIAHAANYARRTGAGLHILHVLEAVPKSLQHALGTKDLEAFQRNSEEQAEARMAKLIAEIPSEGLKITCSIRQGKPAAEILAETKKAKAGLIVCGAGVTEGSEWLIVNTTPDRLLRTSPVPVLIVGPECAERYKRILVPADIDRADHGALNIAARLADMDKARVSVLHVYEVPSVMHRYGGNLVDLRRELKNQATKRLEDFITDPLTKIGAVQPHRLLRRSIDHANVANEVVAEAVRLKMDLIVMALGGISIVRRFVLGSVAERVIRQLPCSLLALPTAWAEKR